MFSDVSLIDEHAEELAQLESADVGHPISDARGVDVPGARNCFVWYAEAIDSSLHALDNYTHLKTTWVGL